MTQKKPETEQSLNLEHQAEHEIMDNNQEVK